MPIDYWKAQRAAFTGFVTNLPQEIRQVLKVYDANGLRYNIRYLSQPETRNIVASLSIEKQAEFVDLRTKNYVGEFLKGAVIDHEDIINELNNIDMTVVSATAIGNIAYWYLYCNNSNIRIVSRIALDDIKDHFGKFNK